MGVKFCAVPLYCIQIALLQWTRLQRSYNMENFIPMYRFNKYAWCSRIRITFRLKMASVLRKSAGMSLWRSHQVKTNVSVNFGEQQPHAKFGVLVISD